jgi:hypothetical protein
VERDHLENPGIDRRKILKRISKKWGWEAVDQVSECGNGLSGSIKWGNFLNR